MKSFSEPPVKLVTRRLRRPAAFAFLAGILLINLVQSHPFFQGNEFLPVANESVQTRSSFDPVFGFMRLYGRVIRHFWKSPHECNPGQALNSFQVDQCAELARREWTSALLGLLPFLMAGAVFVLGLQRLRGLYQLAEGKLQARQAQFMVMTTDPVKAPNDRFGWFLGLQSVGVVFTDGKQVRAYLPEGAPLPEPAQKMALFQWVHHKGEIKYFAVIYAPHLAIIRGS